MDLAQVAEHGITAVLAVAVWLELHLFRKGVCKSLQGIAKEQTRIVERQAQALEQLDENRVKLEMLTWQAKAK